MFKLFSILALLQFFQLSVAPEGGGAETVVEPQATPPAETNSEPATDPTNEPEEVVSPKDAVLEELGLSDPSEPKQEVKPEVQKTPEQLALEAEQAKIITDADLEPLGSRNPSTNERFKKITEGYKEAKTEIETLNKRINQYESSFNAMRELGYNDANAAQDLAAFSEYRKALYSGNAEGFSQILGQQIRQFEAMTGKRVNLNASILDAYPDLSQRVNSLDLDENTAFEVARARAVQERISRDTANRMEVAQQAQNSQQVVNEALGAVEALQSNWTKSDPDYVAILPHLQPRMADIAKKFHPTQWASAIEMQYATLKQALTAQRNAEVNPQPLRGNGFGGAKPIPTNPRDAVLQEMGFAS